MRGTGEKGHEDKPGSSLREFKNIMGALHLLCTSRVGLIPLTGEIGDLMGSGNPGPPLTWAFRSTGAYPVPWFVSSDDSGPPQSVRPARHRSRIQSGDE